MNKIKNKRKRKKMLDRFFLKILISIFLFLGYKVLFLPEMLLLGIILFGISLSIMTLSEIASTRKTRKFLSSRFLFLLFLVGVGYRPSRTYTSSSELSSRSPLGIGVLADVVLMSTFVEVTETVPPPPAATATAAAAPAPAPAPDGNAPAAQATDAATDTAAATAAATATATATAAVATNMAVAASATASGVDGSQPTASGGGQAMVQVPGSVTATSTAAATATETGAVGAAASPTESGEVQVSGLAGEKTAFVSMPSAPSGITTSPIRGKSSPIATSTPSPTPSSTSTSTSSTQKFPTYAAGLASGTAIIAAAGAFTAFYLVRRRNRRYRQRRKPSPVNEIGQVNNNNNNRPFSIRKVSEVMSMTNLSHKACGDGNKLTSMKPPPDIDPETSWPRGYVPPDPEELRERMDDEKRRSGGSREGFVDSAVDLGIGYVSSSGGPGAGAMPGVKRDGYFDGYDGHETVQARPLSEVSMPEHMKPFMTPLQPRHTQGFVPEPVDRAGAISPSIYSHRDSIVTSFGEIHAKIDGNNNFNAHREEYRLRKEQARQFETYDYVEEEEESPDGWPEQDRPLEGSERPEVGRVDEYSSPYTAQRSTASPVNDYFSMQHSTVNHSQPGHMTGETGQHVDYFSTHHSAMNPDNRESQYEDIDLSQNDPYTEGQRDLYAEETTNSNKRNSGGYFGRFFGRGSGR